MTIADHSSTHPLLPPTTEDDRITWLRLLRSHRVGVATFYRLMAAHGSASDALASLPQVARDAGVAKYAACSQAQAEAEYRTGQNMGATLICRGDPAYPTSLATCADAPPLFWALGKAEVLARPMVAIVGARNASSLGLRTARMLANGLAEAGVTIVSGLARGVDAAAHKASLNAGTVAVMAGGLDVIYPKEHTELAAQIVANPGLRLSEHSFGLTPMARHFPTRNRIVAGLAQVTVVVEAAMRSGSLITARQALDYGREVVAVPGHPFDGRAGGCNALIRDGARLVRSVDDVLECLTPDPAPAVPEAPLLPLPTAEAATQPDPQLERRILRQLGPSPVAEDQLIRDLGTSARAVLPTLTLLELRGEIARQPGGLLARAV